MQSGVNPKEVFNSMQALINSWRSLTEVTGGSLSIDKSWWYLVEYVRKRGKWVANDAELGKDLIVTSPTGDRLSLKRLRYDAAS